MPAEKKINKKLEHNMMKPLKVLMLNRDFPQTGGVAHIMLTFARHYDHRRLEVHIASFKPFHPVMAEALGQTGAAMHELGDAGYLRPALALRRIVKEQNFDMVVATSLKAYLVAKLAVPSKCPVLYWIHGIATLIENRLKSAVYRWAARRDTLICISGQVKKAHIYSGHKGREIVVLNGVEDISLSDPPYDLSQRDALDIPRSAFVIGYTAEFIGWKEHKTLLAAFSRLAAEFPEMHLMLIGTGGLWESTQALAREIPGGERIHFLGPRPDARQLLGLMDVYVHPSNGEGFGLAVVEAMLARRAIVFSDAGALPELIDDGATGLMFHVLDAADLASKIALLAKDAEMRQRLGERARQTALERFGPERFAEGITSVLESEPRAFRTTHELI
jgi:glycosyltransferase involved in cell wall biosynthesis